MRPDATRHARFVYAELLNYAGASALRDESSRSRAARRRGTWSQAWGRWIFSDLGGSLDLRRCHGLPVAPCLALGRIDEATALSQEVYDLTERVLAQRPGDLRALQNRFYAADTLAVLAVRRYDAHSAMDFAVRAERAGEDLVRFNPSSLGAWNSWALGKRRVAAALVSQGQISAALESYRSVVAMFEDPRASADLRLQQRGAWLEVALHEASMGREISAREAFAQYVADHEAFVARLPAGSDTARIAELSLQAQRAQLEVVLGENQRSLDMALAVTEAANAMGPDAPPQRNGVLRSANAWATESALRLGRYADAEAAARARLEVPIIGALFIEPEELHAETRVGLAHAIAKQGRQVEALEALEPALARFRGQWEAGVRDTRFLRNFAHALYVDAIAQPADSAGQARRRASLSEAASVLATLTAEAQRTTEVRTVAAWIAAAGS
jgi:tetratricopeptide (TPR) repeat protein